MANQLDVTNMVEQGLGYRIALHNSFNPFVFPLTVVNMPAEIPSGFLLVKLNSRWGAFYVGAKAANFFHRAAIFAPAVPQPRRFLQWTLADESD